MWTQAQTLIIDQCRKLYCIHFYDRDHWDWYITMNWKSEKLHMICFSILSHFASLSLCTPIRDCKLNHKLLLKMLKQMPQKFLVLELYFPLLLWEIYLSICMSLTKYSMHKIISNLDNCQPASTLAWTMNDESVLIPHPWNIHVCVHFLVMIKKYTLGRSPACIDWAFGDRLWYIEQGTVKMFPEETVEEQIISYSHEFQTGAAVLG